MLKILNTMGRQLEEFKPLTEGVVKMYHCGPTVYWNQHIGNMRAMLMGDLIRRSLVYLGYKVTYMRNLTDFGHMTSDADEGEDKMEKAAKRENLDPKIIADKYIAQFEHDTDALNIMRPTISARATDYIAEMIKLVQELVAKGYAYSTPLAVYYDVTKFPHYNDLNGQDINANITGAGAGTVSDPGKKHPADFALWFFKTGDHKNALQFWPSPFSSPDVQNGEGSPGWHIECSAMIRKELGNKIDIHMGGIEHIPVHHTNEIAQSEAANGVKFVNYWVHNEHLTMNDRKIAKSDGNFVLLDDLTAKGYDPLHLRYLFLQSHYRSKQNFTFEALDSARSAYENLLRQLRELSAAGSTGQVDTNADKDFQTALEEDFNIPKALAVMWDLLRSSVPAADKLATVLKFDEVLGLRLAENMKKQPKEQQLTPEISALLAERKAAREAKDWQKADNIRQELLEKHGYKVIDTV